MTASTAELRVAERGDERGPFRNRLADAHSPYLRQHGTNPVDWHPWSPDALALAQRRAAPIFLSVGYAACHWCHVMEDESFADPRVAALLNHSFVCIKVDREEHPDVDAFAMEVLLELTGDAGWPASLFLSPDLVPLDGGTYFPPAFRYGVPGFRDVIRRVEQAWAGQARAGALRRGAATLDVLRQRNAGGEGAAPTDAGAVAPQAVARLVEAADARAGGWGQGAKFPHAPRLRLLLEERGGAGAEQVLHGALEAMERGGLHDHIGGGFHRYTVDPEWDVPHFEKMLIDNAQLASLFVDAWWSLGGPAWLRAGCGALEWMLDELRLPGGALAASLDADDPGGEGVFYTWTPREVRAAVGAHAPSACVALGVSEGGNAGDGRSVPRRHGDLSLIAALRPRLRAARAQRPPPARDDKAVAAYNGLAAEAFARAARRLGDPRYAQAAAAILDAFAAQAPLRRQLGRRPPPAVLEDRASLGLGALELHAATGASRWLRFALRMGDEILTHHQEADSGRLSRCAHGARTLPLASSPVEDGAEPSPVGLAILLLQRLVALQAPGIDPSRVARAQSAAARVVAGRQEAAPTLCRALAQAARPPRTLVVTGTPEDADTRALLRAAGARAPLDVTVVVARPGDPDLAGFGVLANRGRPGLAQAWLCEGLSCRLPVSAPDALARLLAEPAPGAAQRAAGPAGEGSFST